MEKPKNLDTGTINVSHDEDKEIAIEYTIEIFENFLKRNGINVLEGIDCTDLREELEAFFLECGWVL